uniref:Cysteine proteinase inhibitor 5 n=1 Tax=Solanum tuberosum TaxID=4113 RepID=M1AG71_SOLTU
MVIKLNSIIVTPLVVVVIILLHVSAAQGGSYPLNITNPVVIALGQFAVAEHNKAAKTKLEFREVIKRYVRPRYSILYYELIVYAKDDDSLHYYLTYLQREIIWSKPLVLTSFEECDSGNESNVRCNLN